MTAKSIVAKATTAVEIAPRDAAPASAPFSARVVGGTDVGERVGLPGVAVGAAVVVESKTVAAVELSEQADQ